MSLDSRSNPPHFIEIYSVPSDGMQIKTDGQKDRIPDYAFNIATNNFGEEYTGCPRGNVPHFGRMFLTLKYTDITQNTYIRS